MKPGFALSLSFEGISLLQRAAGGWRTVGDVSLETADLAADLAALRNKALALKSGPLRCKLIIPNDQIRFLEVDTGPFSGDARAAMVQRALDGATPYPVTELVFDTSVDGPTTYVAAVARETLAEAESFALEHGFNPVSFVAAPHDIPYLGEPFFGISAHTTTLPDGASIEPDGIAVVVIGPVENHEPAPESLPKSPPKLPPKPESSEPEPLVLTGFTSRRRKVKTPDTPTGETPPPPHTDANTDRIAPSLGGAKRDAPPSPITSHAPEATDSPQLSHPEPVSVTAPTLDLADLPRPETDETPPTSDLGGFMSRRTNPDSHAAEATAPPPAVPQTVLQTSPQTISDPSPHPDLVPVSRPPAKPMTAKDEAARMTVFGAREPAKVGGKPRFLGLILAVALLVFLTVVAVWASVFLDDGLASLFRSSPAKTELAAAPGTPGIGVKADDPVRTSATDSAGIPPNNPPPHIATDPAAELAQLPPADVASLPPQILQSTAPPVAPDLSSTDSAVLDALRQTTEPAQDQAALDANTTTEPPAQTRQTMPGIDILQNAPVVPKTPSIIGLNDLYIASIDRTDLSQDAVALPSVQSITTDQPLGFVNSPVAAGTAFDLDQRGLVTASTGGTLNPDGVMVYLGRPPSVPPKVPSHIIIRPQTDAQRDQLAGKRPRLRPDDLGERFERNNLGGLTRAELSGMRPKVRPKSLKQKAKDADENAAPTAQAVVASRVPKARPRGFDKIVSAAVRPATQDKPGANTAPGSRVEQVATIAPRTVSPKIPSSASVARQATLNNAINLRRVNLIGVYGTPSNRRALVRLPSGRYKKVKVGDAVDGGRVVAIGDSQLRYQKGGRNMTLKIPNG